MLIHTTVLEKTGIVNGTFDVLVSDKKIEKEEILKALRIDREEGIHSKYMIDKNPSKDPKEIEFFYEPTRCRQKISTGKLPCKISTTINLIDAFVCLGSRFGLQPLNVFVEVYQSTCGYRGIWAKIYYVADSEIPVCIITAKTYTRNIDINIKV